jgi:hypothetical protein
MRHAAGARNRGRVHPTRVSRVESRRALRARRRQRRNRLAVCLLLVLTAALIGVDLLRGPPSEPTSAAATAGPGASPGADNIPALLTDQSPSREPAPDAAPSPVLQEPGDVPVSGPGTWSYAADAGPVFGTAGKLQRFMVAVESNIAGAELAGFTDAVDAALGDPRGWTASRQLRLQRVPFGQVADFTIFLATGQTTYQLCRTAGLDVRLDGEFYTSCRVFGKVVINLNRWRLSVPEYVAAGVPLAAYRAYVVNHETGHQLGHGHEGCPGAGRPAPVMQQQTYGLTGCTAYSWPYLDGKRYTGPEVA